jgi:DNA-binding NtrC family response regulator
LSDWSSTLDVPDSRPGAEDAAGGDVLSLVIAWAGAEPERVGEAAIFAPDGAPRILGRGSPVAMGPQAAPNPGLLRSPSSGPTGGRVAFVRQRPAVSEPTSPLSSRGLSREQLRVIAADDRLVVENVGRCPMTFNGDAVQRCTMRPGDTLLFKSQLLLVCARRPREMRLLRDFPASSVGPFGEPDALGIVGESPAIWRLRDRIAWNAKAGRHVLLLGESGTGKELAARALHALSPRAGKPFVARNAATIPAGLLEAELFGNVKGYPNPGMPERPGLVGEADGGTLFLDEIGELPPSLHAGLLRVLDGGGEYHRLGGSTTRRADIRLVAATNRDPGALKHDLLARLTLRLTMPSLAERREDIPLLARHLLRAAFARSPELTRHFVSAGGGPPEPRVGAELIEHLLHHRYETHVRELDAKLWRAMSASSGDTIRYTHESIQQALDASPPGSPAAPPAAAPEPVSDDSTDAGATPPYEEPSAERIRACLTEHGGNVSRAARALELPSRYVLYRLLRKHGIEVDGVRGDRD